MSQHIKVITFDLDNTLWDVEPALVAAEEAQFSWLQEHRPRLAERFSDQALRDFRMEFHRSRPELMHQISEIRVEALFAALRESGYAETQAREGAQQAFAIFLEHRHRVQPYDQVVETLQQLARHYTLGALTNGNADIFRTDIGDHFDFAFSAEQLNASKPLPDMFHASLEHTGASSNEVVHVGDNPEHDVHGAQVVGFHTVWMNSGGWRWPEHRPAADEVITELVQLPAAIERIEKRLKRKSRNS